MSDVSEYRTGKQIKLYRLADLTGPDAAPAPVADPQTGGDLWKVWPTTGGSELSVLYCWMGKGQQTGLHSHPTHHYGVVLNGNGLVYIDGRVYEQLEGDLIHIPPDLPHSFGGTRDDDCWLIDFVKPSMTLDQITYYPERDADVRAAVDEFYRARTGTDTPGA
jgi:quercetin dioxygenase-like cupin family protein